MRNCNRRGSAATPSRRLLDRSLAPGARSGDSYRGGHTSPAGLVEPSNLPVQKREVADEIRALSPSQATRSGSVAGFALFGPAVGNLGDLTAVGFGFSVRDRACCEDQGEVAERLGEVADGACPPTSYSSASRPRSLARPTRRSNSARASSTRPLRASALTSQNEQARNWPLSPGSPSSVAAVAVARHEDRQDRAHFDTASMVPVTRSSVSRQEPHQWDVQDAGVELPGTVVLGERTPFAVCPFVGARARPMRRRRGCARFPWPRTGRGRPPPPGPPAPGRRPARRRRRC